MSRLRSLAEIFRIFLRLGLTSFGGPMAHLGYFRQEFVVRRKWLDEQAYADLVALCQFLPGPASSQVGMALGLSRGGLWGALAAWLGFTLPSAVALVCFGLWFSHHGDHGPNGWIGGLKILAVAIVAQAVLGMAKGLCPDSDRRAIALSAVAGTFILPGICGQMMVMAVGALSGYLFLKPSQPVADVPIPDYSNKNNSAVFLWLFFILLVLLPVLGAVTGQYGLKLFDSFYRAGALVFGGGHVVLPLLRSQVVTPGWVSDDMFLAGYGAAQAVPGPLFTFAAFLGAVSSQHPSGWTGAAVALAAIFLPSFLLVAGILPFWERLRRWKAMQSIMPGVNASVVGILLAAWYDPVITSALHGWTHLALAILALSLLVFARWPSWLVAVVTVVLSGMILT